MWASHELALGEFNASLKGRLKLLGKIDNYTSRTPQKETEPKPKAHLHYEKDGTDRIKIGTSTTK